MKRIQPAVVIGLGGTGVRTITFLKKTLQEQAADVMQFVRFLAVDIDELKGEVPAGSLFGQSIRLDPEKNEFFRIVDQTRGAEASSIPSVANWFPSEGYKYLPLTEGARQAKPIGRLGFFLAHDEIARRIQRLTDRIVTPDTLRSFPGLRAGHLNIYVVSSICGGTGAGLFSDFAYELRYLQQLADLPERTRIKGLFALGDIYDAVSQRVLANTYASLRELNWVQRERASFHPVYPDGQRNVIQSPAFDAIYLFGNSNASNIEFSSPIDFAQLCAEFIFLDSGADALENGDPLSAMMQSMRNNAEVYTMNHDADGTPRIYSALGLCKIRFPAERVAELCAARMSREILEHHILGRLSQPEILDARRKAQELISTAGLGCDDESKDLPDRLVDKELDGGERAPLGQWVTQALHKAFNNDLDRMSSLAVSRFNQIVNTLQSELKQSQSDSASRVIDELHSFQRVLEQVIAKMFQENLGVSFVAKFLEALLESARSSRDYAQQELKNLLGHEKRLTDQMQNHIREMGDLLEQTLFGVILRGEARRAQLRETYKAIRQFFLNQIDAVKMRSAISFYDGVYDAKQQLMEGGTGAIAILSRMVTNIALIQSFVDKLAQGFRTAYDDNKRIEGSPFEILIYDNESFSELRAIFDSVHSDALRATLFEVVLQSVGGSLWHLRDLIDAADGEARLRGYLMAACKPPFLAEINKKTVAQRIYEARHDVVRPRDYTPNLQSAYEIASYFCKLNEVAARFADLRSSEQAIACVVAYQDESDAAWREVERTLRESMGHSGRQLPFVSTADRHSILIYREFCGFPAYTLSRIEGYHTSFVAESTRDNTPPLQMLTKEPLAHVNVPTSPVLSKYQVLAVEALALGVILCDGEENYYLVTQDEWRRRKLAEDAQRQGRPATFEDRMAGSQRRMGTRLGEVVGLLGEKMPEEARLSADMERFEEQVRLEVEQRKVDIDREVLCDLFEALYFGGFEGTKRERIDLENEIRPAVAFILRREFALRKEHIFRPDRSHDEILRSIYLRPLAA